METGPFQSIHLAIWLPVYILDTNLTSFTGGSYPRRGAFFRLWRKVLDEIDTKYFAEM